MADDRGTGAADPAGSGEGPHAGVSRRTFMQTFGATAALGALSQQAEGAFGDQPRDVAQTVDIVGPDPVPITLQINGKILALTLDPTTTLLEALREHLNLTGSKEICDRGACGGCSVLVDGMLIYSCMMLALDAVGSQVTTIEGLGENGQLDPVQESFIRHDAMQCGYCTPGCVMATRALLDETPRPTLAEIKAGLSGNLCRCGAYVNIFNAALDASGQKPVQDQAEVSR